MSKIKLIASDLDGTLLLNFAKNCNPELFPIVEELTKRNLFCTGKRTTVRESAETICPGKR